LEFRYKIYLNAYCSVFLFEFRLRVHYYWFSTLKITFQKPLLNVEKCFLTSKSDFPTLKRDFPILKSAFQRWKMVFQGWKTLFNVKKWFSNVEKRFLTSKNTAIVAQYLQVFSKTGILVYKNRYWFSSLKNLRYTRIRFLLIHH